MKTPLIIGTQEVSVLDKFNEFSKYLLDKKYKEASEILDKITDSVATFSTSQLTYLRDLLRDHGNIITKLRSIANNKSNEQVSSSVLELCDNFENKLEGCNC